MVIIGSESLGVARNMIWYMIYGNAYLKDCNVLSSFEWAKISKHKNALCFVHTFSLNIGPSQITLHEGVIC